VSSPIAIVGRACLLPSAASPAELARLAREGRDAITQVDPRRWGLSSGRVMGSTNDTSGDRTWTDRGGYVTGFEERFDPTGFGLPPEEILRLDPIFQWTMHVARECMRDAGPKLLPERTGAILGNLSFPTGEHARFAESVWFEGSPYGGARPDPKNRFSSGLPALMLGKALGLKGPRYCLDAACASSLYAIALACRALADGEVDWMLAGAVNRADDLFIHVGFCALQAMSKTGRSRPFHADADGLVPAEGCAMVALRRLEDALKDGDRILGIIRGVGLSNDGRGRGLLSPHEGGQVRAMRAAWAEAEMDPAGCAYVECHATGTPVGDGTELRSMREVFGHNKNLRIGSFKGNFGHAVTVAGAAGLLKVLASFEARELFPTPHVEKKNPVLAETPFTVVEQIEPWPPNKPLLAAVSAFGFGGNDAHLVVDGHIPTEVSLQKRTQVIRRPPRVAITAIGAQVGSTTSSESFAMALAGGGPIGARAEQVELELTGLRFPPADLEQTLAQQTMLLAAVREAKKKAPGLDASRTAILVGMGCDAEVARWGARWRIADRAIAEGETEDFVKGARDAIAPHLRAATVVGTMPNIPANRASSDLDAQGPSFTVSAEERSGTYALRIGRRMLEDKSIDAALIGAVDLCCEPVHQIAAAALLPAARQKPADAAVVLLLEREEDAKRSGRTILAIVGDDFVPQLEGEATFGVEGSPLNEKLGHAHAASGLLHVAAAALGLHHPEVGRALGFGTSDAVRVVVPCLYGESGEIALLAGQRNAPLHGPLPLSGRTLSLPAHLPRITLPAARKALSSQKASPPVSKATQVTPHTEVHVRSTNGSHGSAPQVMAPPPWVAPVGAAIAVSGSAVSGSAVSGSAAAAPRAAAPAPGLAPRAPSLARPASPIATPAFEEETNGGHADPMFAALAAQHAAMAEAHRVFLETQTELHHRFLSVRERAVATLVGAQGGELAHAEVAGAEVGRLEAPAFEAWSAPAPIAAPISAPISAPIATPISAPIARPTVAAKGTPAPAAAPLAKKTTRGLQPNPFPRPVGRSWNRDELKIDASGKISEIFGPEFAPQDACVVQTRMPMEPMLLADRVTGIDATPAAMLLPLEADPKRRKGTVWTETDITRESWYLHQGRMPGGILIESGQADLFLISYLGVDLLNLGSARTVCWGASSPTTAARPASARPSATTSTSTGTPTRARSASSSSTTTAAFGAPATRCRPTAASRC
jgi:3-oxoacyl-(acyl-carrier-protein) synthase